MAEDSRSSAPKEKNAKKKKVQSAGEDNEAKENKKSYDGPKYDLQQEEKLQVIRQFYATHDPSKTEEQIADLLAKPKYAANFGSLCKGLEKKYAVDPVDAWVPNLSKKDRKQRQKEEKRAAKEEAKQQIIFKRLKAHVPLPQLSPQPWRDAVVARGPLATLGVSLVMATVMVGITACIAYAFCATEPRG